MFYQYADINALKFVFRNEQTQRTKSLQLCLRRKSGTYTTYGNLLIPYVVFCASRHVARWSKVIKYFACLMSPITCSFPIIARLLEFESFAEFVDEVGMYQTGVVWYFICFISMTYNLMLLIEFCCVVALDFKRRYQFVRFSTRLIELNKNAFEGFVNYTDYKEHLFPNCAATKQGRKALKSSIIQTLDLSDAETMYNWSKLRAFFLDFGLRFLRREEAILGYFVLSIFLIVAFYFTMLYLEMTAINLMETAFVIMSSLAVLSPAFIALRYATKINEKVNEQRHILADKRLRLENERSLILIDDNGQKKVLSEDQNEDDNDHQIERATPASIGRASVMLEKIMKIMEVDRFRIRLLGYPIDTTVTGIVAFVVGAIGFLVARLILQDRAEGIPDL